MSTTTETNILAALQSGPRTFAQLETALFPPMPAVTIDGVWHRETARISDEISDALPRLRKSGAIVRREEDGLIVFALATAV